MKMAPDVRLSSEELEQLEVLFELGRIQLVYKPGHVSCFWRQNAALVAEVEKLVE
jgi:hypothetical protein